ncbi:MAG: RnfABCDGE type electron transport complex subunit D [Spirochaetales bacterium]|nr:RnfABCDGE type electron transport complex subunit D [Spirochaetales bacterium]
MPENKFQIASSPQFHSGMSTSMVMGHVSLALVPASLWGVYVFGWRALVVLLVSIAASVLSEYVLCRVSSQENSIADGSALLTGLLIGMNMPPAVPLFIPIIASFFAIFVVKWTFGGLGANWMNPALAGRVFVFMSWTGGMTTWTLPGRLGNSGTMDAVTGPTPLGSLKTGLMNGVDGVSGPLQLLAGEGVPVTYKDLFIGNIPGCIGEVSAVLLLAGALYLIVRKIITWHIPVVYALSFSVLVWIFGGNRYGSGFFSGDVLFHLLSGGFMLGALFMATDMATSPVTKKGKVIYAIGCGFMTFLIRFYGSFPEGVSLAIIFMNIFVPLIDRMVKPVTFGVAKVKKAKSKEAAQ